VIRNRFDMTKRNLITTTFILFCIIPVTAQVSKQEYGLKREVTLYNPYKPSLPEVKKRSFLPVMNDTIKLTPEFHYDIKTKAFMPEYTISPIKAAALLSDPLPKLYKSYVNIGIGNYLTPLAEVSITNERSKKGAIGFYGRHFSSNGKIMLPNGKRIFAGYMDNDVSLFGKKFFRKNFFESSVDFSQKIRHAYGYDPFITDYTPDKSDIKMRYNDFGVKASLASLTLDSTTLSYDFDIYYNFFSYTNNLFQHSAGFTGFMAKSYSGFFVGSGIGYDYYIYSDSLDKSPDHIISISPFIKKSTEQWSFKLGFQALLDKVPNPHIYPDINFGFSVVQSYISFFAGLSGKLERNIPAKIITENPFLANDQFPDFLPNGILFRLPDTDHELIVSAGLKGNTGIGGNYILSASYSLISDMLFYTNIVFPDSVVPTARGNFFLPILDDVELLNIHAEMSGPLNDNFSFSWMANLYNYTVGTDYAWNKPAWDGKAGLKYNLRDKIIAGIELSAQGKRKMIVNGDPLSSLAGYTSSIIEMPAHFNLSLGAEYRYSKILSLWTKFNNISYNRYHEWVYYPSQGFICMVGFTYSL
jgi:hypothetical protein